LRRSNMPLLEFSKHRADKTDVNLTKNIKAYKQADKCDESWVLS